MKRVFLFLFIFLFIGVSLAQDFRRSTWNMPMRTVAEREGIRAMYPITVDNGSMLFVYDKVFRHDAVILYIFQNDKLMAGCYRFTEFPDVDEFYNLACGKLVEKYGKYNMRTITYDGKTRSIASWERRRTNIYCYTKKIQQTGEPAVMILYSPVKIEKLLDSLKDFDEPKNNENV